MIERSREELEIQNAEQAERIEVLEDTIRRILACPACTKIAASPHRPKSNVVPFPGTRFVPAPSLPPPIFDPQFQSMEPSVMPTTTCHVAASYPAVNWRPTLPTCAAGAGMSFSFDQSLICTKSSLDGFVLTTPAST